MPSLRERGEKGLRLERQAARLAADDLVEREKPGGGELPGALWKSMSRRGLLGWSIPKSCGGSGATYSEILPALCAFVENGGRPGVALSWVVHLIVAKLLIKGAGTRATQREILPAMAAGTVTTSIALSEPGAGSDPKRLRATARKRKGRYILDGEKAWLTNGPMADYFVVFASTGRRGDRKQFTAFLLPKDLPGLTVVDMAPLGYLEPAGHCAIRLESCACPEAAIIGRKGQALEELSKPFRVVEDTLLAGVILGGLGWQLKGIVGSLQESRKPLDSGLLERIGAAVAMLGAARQIAKRAAEDLDRDGPGTTMDRTLASLQLMEKLLQECAASIREELGDAPPGAPGAAGEDIARLIGLGMHALRARQRKTGDMFLSGKETS